MRHRAASHTGWRVALFRGLQNCHHVGQVDRADVRDVRNTVMSGAVAWRVEPIELIFKPHGLGVALLRRDACLCLGRWFA